MWKLSPHIDTCAVLEINSFLKSRGIYATVDAAATPAGFAVREIATAIDSSYMDYNPVTYASDDWTRRIAPIVPIEAVEKGGDNVSSREPFHLFEDWLPVFEVVEESAGDDRIKLMRRKSRISRVSLNIGPLRIMKPSLCESFCRLVYTYKRNLFPLIHHTRTTSEVHNVAGHKRQNRRPDFLVVAVIPFVLPRPSLVPELRTKLHTKASLS